MIVLIILSIVALAASAWWICFAAKRIGLTASAFERDGEDTI